MAHAGGVMWLAAARPPPVEAARLSLSLRAGPDGAWAQPRTSSRRGLRMRRAAPRPDGVLRRVVRGTGERVHGQFPGRRPQGDLESLARLDCRW